MADLKTASPQKEGQVVKKIFERERKLDHEKATDLEKRRERIMELLEAEEGSVEQKLVDFLMSLTPVQRDELKEARLGEFLDPQGERLRLMELVHLRDVLKPLRKSGLAANDQIAADQAGFIEEILDRLGGELEIFASRTGNAKRLEQVEKSPQLLINFLTNLEGVKNSAAKEVASRNWEKVNVFNAEVMRLLKKIQDLLDVVAQLDPDRLAEMGDEIRGIDASKADVVESILLVYLKTHRVQFSTRVEVKALAFSNARRKRGGKPDFYEKLYEASRASGVGLNPSQFLKELASGLVGIPERRVDAAMEAAFPKPAREKLPRGKPVIPAPATAV